MALGLPLSAMKDIVAGRGITNIFHTCIEHEDRSLYSHREIAKVSDESDLITITVVDTFGYREPCQATGYDGGGT